MGYKTITTHYDIKHIVQERTNDQWGRCILIGSPYISGIIVIRKADGKIVKGYDYESVSCNEDLQRYQAALLKDAENGTLLKLIQQPDNFENSLPVYTYNKWRVEKHWCEERGYPNVTFTGELMYENTFFETRKEAYQALKRNAGKMYSAKYAFRSLIEEMKRLFQAIYRNSSQWLLSRTIGRFYTKRII